jgi:TonB family protein
MIVALAAAGFSLASALASEAPLPDCTQGSLDVPGRAVCLAAQELESAERAERGTPERERHLQASADACRAAANATTDSAMKRRVLNLLADLYDDQHLDRPTEMEAVVRELIAAAPGDLPPLYRLAKLHEDRGFFSEAEETLLQARRQAPEDDPEPFSRLAQLYARRVVAMQEAAERLKPPEPQAKPGEPDRNGTYRPGGPVAPPHRVDMPQYPTDAKDAGIQGAVVAEITINEMGRVTDAKVVRSVPLLDDAALKAVREWRYEPTIVNGKPVPLTMQVTVNFQLPR